MNTKDPLAPVFARHIQSFVHMVKEADYTQVEAWAAILTRTTLGPASLEILHQQCIAAVDGKGA